MLVLRKATADDLGSVRRWRNHPDVRAMSFTTHEITEHEHREWWRAVTADPTRQILIYERYGVPSGVLTFSDLRDDSASWGFYLDVAGLEQRRELLPAWLEIEREVVAYAFDELGLNRLSGETLASNESVRSLHRRFGFVETGTSVRLVDGRLVEVVQIELLAANRRLPRPRPAR